MPSPIQSAFDGGQWAEETDNGVIRHRRPFRTPGHWFAFSARNQCKTGRTAASLMRDGNCNATLARRRRSAVAQVLHRPQCAGREKPLCRTWESSPLRPP